MTFIRQVLGLRKIVFSNSHSPSYRIVRNVVYHNRHPQYYYLNEHNLQGEQSKQSSSSSSSLPSPLSPPSLSSPSFSQPSITTTKKNDQKESNQLQKQVRIPASFIIVERPPTPMIGLKGKGNTFTLILPQTNQERERMKRKEKREDCTQMPILGEEDSLPFTLSPVLSALYTMSCVSVLIALSQNVGNVLPIVREACSGGIEYFLRILPAQIAISIASAQPGTRRQYEDPSYLWFSQFMKPESLPTTLQLPSSSPSIASSSLRKSSSSPSSSSSSRDSHSSTATGRGGDINAVSTAAEQVMSAVVERLSFAEIKNLSEKLATFREFYSFFLFSIHYISY